MEAFEKFVEIALRKRTRRERPKSQLPIITRALLPMCSGLAVSIPEFIPYLARHRNRHFAFGSRHGHHERKLLEPMDYARHFTDEQPSEEKTSPEHNSFMGGRSQVSEHSEDLDSACNDSPAGGRSIFSGQPEGLNAACNDLFADGRSDASVQPKGLNLACGGLFGGGDFGVLEHSEGLAPIYNDLFTSGSSNFSGQCEGFNSVSFSSKSEQISLARDDLLEGGSYKVSENSEDLALTCNDFFARTDDLNSAGSDLFAYGFHISSAQPERLSLAYDELFGGEGSKISKDFTSTCIDLSAGGCSNSSAQFESLSLACDDLFGGGRSDDFGRLDDRAAICNDLFADRCPDFPGQLEGLNSACDDFFQDEAFPLPEQLGNPPACSHENASCSLVAPPFNSASIFTSICSPSFSSEGQAVSELPLPIGGSHHVSHIYEKTMIYEAFQF